jgi:hypothetical protein
MNQEIIQIMNSAWKYSQTCLFKSERKLLLNEYPMENGKNISDSCVYTKFLLKFSDIYIPFLCVSSIYIGQTTIIVRILDK